MIVVVCFVAVFGLVHWCLMLYVMFSVFSEGEEWLKMRSVLRQLVMRPRDVAVFAPDVNAVVEDLIKRIKTLRSQQTDGQTVENINDLFFKYAMEGEPKDIVFVCKKWLKSVMCHS